MDDLTYPRARGSRPSEAAAEGIKPRAPKQCVRILAYVRGRGKAGATQYEVVRDLKIKQNSVQPRMVELEASGFVLRDPAITRPTDTNHMAEAYVATDREGDGSDAKPLPSARNKRAEAAEARLEVALAAMAEVEGTLGKLTPFARGGRWVMHFNEMRAVLKKGMKGEPRS